MVRARRAALSVQVCQLPVSDRRRFPAARLVATWTGRFTDLLAAAAAVADGQEDSAPMSVPAPVSVPAHTVSVAGNDDEQEVVSG